MTESPHATEPTGLVDVPWALTDEHRAWRKTMREFALDVVAPGAAERSIHARFDPDLVRAAARLGMFGLVVPEALGGTGADIRTLCITVEELAAVDASFAVTVHVQAISAALLARLAGDRGDLAGLIQAAAAGETFVAFGLTEPSSGSDAGNIATNARRDGDSWIVNGAKQFITNSGTPFSKHVTLFTKTGEGRPGRPEVSALLVPLDAPGVTVGDGYPKLGWRSSDTHPLFFDDVRIPAANLLGGEGSGYREALQFLTWARLPIAAMSVGAARGCLEDTLRFVRDRESFGRPLGSHQAVAFGVADLSAMTATARLLTYDAAWKFDHGDPVRQEAAIAKLVASELANKAGYLATQLQGGYGFITETAASRHYADARILTIGEGTSEVQRMLIARGLGFPV